MTSGECLCSSEESTEINTFDNCLSTLPICDLNDIVQELTLIEHNVAKLACEQIKKSRNNQTQILSEFHEVAKHSKSTKPIEPVKHDETTQYEDDDDDDVYEDVEKESPRREKREAQKSSTPPHSRSATANNDDTTTRQRTPRNTTEGSFWRSKILIVLYIILLAIAFVCGYTLAAWLCSSNYCDFCIPYPFTRRAHPRPY